ncbi:unnamed protein product, partial [Iphiclides podalirius]
MKLFLVALCCLTALALAEEPLRFYHENVGIREAELIRQTEQALDFDGARIVGGTQAALGQYPYMAGLVVTLTNGATSVCGASLLTNTRLVTAAHCWWDGRNQARQFTVVLASLRLFSGGTRINTNSVVMHGSWNPSSLNNDIAVITISRVNFSNVIGPINLASGNNNYAGTWAMAAGFGRTRDSAGISTSQMLYHVSLRVITNAECLNVYGDPFVISSTLCVSGEGGRNICRGDSGGPLAVGTTLIGVASFVSGRGCQIGLPSGFARVTSYNAWIWSQLT